MIIFLGYDAIIASDPRLQHYRLLLKDNLLILQQFQVFFLGPFKLVGVLGSLLGIDRSDLNMVEVACFQGYDLGSAWLDNHVEVSFSHQQLKRLILFWLQQLRLKELNLERDLQVVRHLHR